MIPNSETYDYVIVGAGSAGCVLANRLTESGKYRVLLLEAGPRDTNPWIHIPLGYGKLFTDLRTNWAYQSAPEPHLDNRSIYNPRGKVLGGSSSINGLVYVRGQREDFDGWRDAGNPGWGFDDVLPYFKRAEDQARGADAWHGTGGPLSIADPSEPHPICDAFIEGAEELQIPRNDDFNGAAQEGAGYFQFTARNGLRCSAATAYLKPARGRANLCILTEALATRILFEGRRAVGVRYRRRGAERTVSARREIVLAGGAFNSPQLLQLSGVGPGALLQKLGIPVVLAQEAVGRNYQDHLQTRIILKCTAPITLNDDVATLWRKAGMGLRFALSRKGPLTIGAGYAGGFFRTNVAEDARPDMQCHLVLFSLDKMGTALHRFSAFTMSVCQLRPESRGEVMAVSPDPAAPPSIRANFLSTERDRRVHVEGLKLLRRLAATPAMLKFVKAEYLPGPSIGSDADLLAYCRKTASTIYHPSSTCRMGSDADAVVDSCLKVHRLGGLRVVDFSIAPSVVSGNTNAAAIMIAEKAADMMTGNGP
jgi:choline dehydrogenase